MKGEAKMKEEILDILWDLFPDAPAHIKNKCAEKIVNLFDKMVKEQKDLDRAWNESNTKFM